MELKSKQRNYMAMTKSEIRDKQINYVFRALFLKLQTAEMNFEKLLG